MSMNPNQIYGPNADGTSSLVDPNKTLTLQKILAMRQQPNHQAYKPYAMPAPTSAGEGLVQGLGALAQGLILRNQNKDADRKHQATLDFLDKMQREQANAEALKSFGQRTTLQMGGASDNTLDALKYGLVKPEAFSPVFVGDYTADHVNQRLGQYKTGDGAPMNLGNIDTPLGVNTARLITGVTPQTVTDSSTAHLKDQYLANQVGYQPAQQAQDLTKGAIAIEGQQIQNATDQIQLNYEDAAQKMKLSLDQLELQQKKQEIPARSEEIANKRKALEGYSQLMGLINRAKTDPSFAASRPDLNLSNPQTVDWLNTMLGIAGYRGDFKAPAHQQVKRTVSKKDGNVTTSETRTIDPTLQNILYGQ